jgi:hypothetical protein
MAKFGLPIIDDVFNIDGGGIYTSPRVPIFNNDYGTEVISGRVLVHWGDVINEPVRTETDTPITTTIQINPTTGQATTTVQGNTVLTAQTKRKVETSDTMPVVVNTSSVPSMQVGNAPVAQSAIDNLVAQAKAHPLATALIVAGGLYFLTKDKK